MSATTLSNPLDRLSVLPTTMNWRGGWSETEQYYLNDIVISSVNQFGYILTITSIIGNGDPSTSDNWTELAAATTSDVQSIISGSDYIDVVENPPKNYTILNKGIIKINTGDGIQNAGTDQNPTLINTGPYALVEGNGIKIFGLPNPIIQNTGVEAFIGGNSGITIQGSKIINTGSVTLLEGNGIHITETVSGYNISKDGPMTLDASTGLVNSGTTISPILKNNGVVTITSEQNGNVTVTNGLLEGQILLSSNNSDLGALASTQYATIPFIQSTQTCDIIITSGNNQWQDYFANGAPDPNGTFMLDLSQIVWNPWEGGTIGTDEQLTVYLSDAPNLPLYNIPNANIYFQTTGTITCVSIGKLYINVAAARAAGYTIGTFIYITITNGTASQFMCVNIPTAYTVYYPNGFV